MPVAPPRLRQPAWGIGSPHGNPLAGRPIGQLVLTTASLDRQQRGALLRGVIRGFRDRDAEQLFDRRPIRRLEPAVRRVALRKLRMLDAAVRLGDLRVPPENRLEKLRGYRSGQHSIRVNDRWRICFRWRGGDAYHVEIVDYH